MALSSPTPKPFNVKDVSATDAKALVNEARSWSMFEVRAHAKGVTSPEHLLIPLAQLKASIPGPLAGAKGRSIIVYCNDGMISGPGGRRSSTQRGPAEP